MKTNKQNSETKATAPKATKERADVTTFDRKGKINLNALKANNRKAQRDIIYRGKEIMDNMIAAKQTRAAALATLKRKYPGHVIDGKYITDDTSRQTLYNEQSDKIARVCTSALAQSRKAMEIEVYRPLFGSDDVYGAFMATVNGNKSVKSYHDVIRDMITKGLCIPTGDKGVNYLADILLVGIGGVKRASDKSIYYSGNVARIVGKSDFMDTLFINLVRVLVARNIITFSTRVNPDKVKASKNRVAKDDKRAERETVPKIATRATATIKNKTRKTA